jgi:flagellin-like hook-associated protein FlgL
MASPAYEDFTDQFGATRSSTPAVEDRDNHPLRYGPGVKAGVANSSDPTVELVNSNGGKAVKLDTGYIEFQNGNGFGIYHGPAIVSDEFTILANKPKIVRLDYTAAGVNDDFHVAGYIYEVNPATGAHIVDPSTGKAKITMAVNETAKVETAGRAGSTVTDAGTYRFVFVVGTHDLTGGLIAGADMTVDNIVAEDPYAITDVPIQELLRAVHYENSAASAAGNKTLTASVESGDKSLFVRDKALMNMQGFDSPASDGPFMIVPSLNFTTQPSEGGTGSAVVLTKKIEVVQDRINLARTQAGSQYGALEEAIDSTTDLRSQFALGSGTLSDLNFSMETVNLTRRQMQQDVASSVLAQANKTQSSLVSLVDGSYRTYLNAQFSHLK